MSKKNSIKENIKILRESIIEEKYYIYNEKFKDIIEHVLSDHEKVLKENEQLQTEVNSLKGKLDEIDKINFPILY